MTDRAKLLIVDDDPRLRGLLHRYLDEQGFEVSIAADGEQMNERLKREHFHLMILDLMLPGEDGLAICNRLRGQGEQIPIIMLTAKGDEIDRIIGLELGADDYVPKPCNPRELVARIRAVLRRQTQLGPGAPVESGETIEFGGMKLNLGTREFTRDGKTTRLTTGEFGLLKVLVTHANRPMSRDHLMNHARGKSHDAFDRSIDVQISKLRKMIESDPSSPRYIQTVWGVGYVFAPDKEK